MTSAFVWTLGEYNWYMNHHVTINEAPLRMCFSLARPNGMNAIYGEWCPSVFVDVKVAEKYERLCVVLQGDIGNSRSSHARRIQWSDSPGQINFVNDADINEYLQNDAFFQCVIDIQATQLAKQRELFPGQEIQLH